MPEIELRIIGAEGFDQWLRDVRRLAAQHSRKEDDAGDSHLGSERKRHSRKKELPHFTIVHDRITGDENAVSRGHRKVAGHLPVDIDIWLNAQPATVDRHFIDWCIFVELGEGVEIGSELETAKWLDIRERKRRGADTEHQQ